MNDFKVGALLDTASKFALFSVFGLKDEKLIKSKPTWKQKHANSIVESFEHFCQMSSKSIPRAYNYELYACFEIGPFFETQCINAWIGKKTWYHVRMYGYRRQRLYLRTVLLRRTVYRVNVACRDGQMDRETIACSPLLKFIAVFVQFLLVSSSSSKWK